MGRERFHFLPFPRPVGPPFGILTYPDGRVGVIHPSAWKANSQKFALLAWECGSFVARVSWARAKGLARSQKREAGVCIVSDAHETNHESHACCGPGYASPEEAMKA